MHNCKQLYIIYLMLFTMAVSVSHCLAVPSQFGDTGLMSQPTAETLNSGNICVGIIANCNGDEGKSTTILPVFMTLGLGSFLEAYGSYPNVLFNQNEEVSGRGFSNVGMKIRLLGKRSSQFKFSLDGQLRRTVSSNINYDGLTDSVYRAIASYDNGRFGLHGNAGYINPESPPYISYEKQFIYGGGVEYLPTSRLRLLTEVGIESAKIQGRSDRAEVTAGLQYFLSPHLTLNVAFGKGFSDESPDWRALFGFSSCQGIGTYQRPVPRKIVPKVEEPVEEKEDVKKLKIRTLKPLSSRKNVVEPPKSSSKYEVPIGEQAEVVTLSPAAETLSERDPSLSVDSEPNVTASVPLTISSGVPLLQVAPEIVGSVASTALALPVNDTISLSPPRKARSYKLNDMVKTDDNQVVGKKIVEDLRYAAQFFSITETSNTFTAHFFHKFDKSLDVWIEGPGKSSAQLSKTVVAPYEEVTLTIDKVNGKVPYFKLHLGEFSEVFEFFPLRKSVKLSRIDINVTPALSNPAPADTSEAAEALEVTSYPVPVAGVSAADSNAADAPSPVKAVEASRTISPVAASSLETAAKNAAPVAAASLPTAAQVATPVVGEKGVLPGFSTAPAVGIVAAAEKDAAPVAGGSVTDTAVADAPAPVKAVTGSRAIPPVAGSSLETAAKSAAPVAAASLPTAAQDAAPVVGEKGTLSGFSAAPAVGTVAAADKTVAPVAGGSVTDTAAAEAPAPVKAVAGSRTIPPVAASSLETAAKNVAPVAAASLPAVAKSAVLLAGSGVVSSTTVLSPPRAGKVSATDNASVPTASDLSNSISIDSAPEAGGVKVVTEVTATPGGAKVILLDSGVAPVAGQISKHETMNVRPPASGSLASISKKAIEAVAFKKFLLPSTVIFAFDDATLTEEGKAAIADVVDAITTEKRWYVLRVDGFTDSLGSDDYNLKLGLRRAISVARYMVTNNGVDPSIVFVKSSGENNPIATNDTEEGRSLNRRAEIILFVQKDE